MNRILLFKLSSCGPCKAVSKTLSELSYKYEEMVIDLDDNADSLADKYKIRSVPTILVLNNEGEELDRFVGFKTKEQLLEDLNKYKIFDNE